MKFEINKPQRLSKMRAHTATHLLHTEIAKILPSTQQAGSFVDDDYLRFDFQSDKLLSPQQLQNIESNINNYIYKAIDVQTQEMWMQEAEKLGAKAFFEDKYGDVVRVVSIAKNKEKPISIELCGGTHVSNTSEIWAFKIIVQEAVASWIKRIVAITWPKVAEEFILSEQKQWILSAKLGVTSKQFPDKLDKTIREYEELQTKFDSLLQQTLNQNIKIAYDGASGNESIPKIILIDKKFDGIDFKDIVLVSKNIVLETTLIYNNQHNFAIISPDKKAKDIAQKYKLKWGWQDQLFQWRDPKIQDFITI